ncbi:hypothetical protein KKA17_05710 [bacterium]|nr:hypothetical protein [bacterium]MBU1882623.1 hypothetical protein [bacterium]
MNKKQELILDIQNLLNSYGDVKKTDINPALLEFMDEDTLKNIISSLLYQKEQEKDVDLKWLEQFKKYGQI